MSEENKSKFLPFRRWYQEQYLLRFGPDAPRIFVYPSVEYTNGIRVEWDLQSGSASLDVLWPSLQAFWHLEDNAEELNLSIDDGWFRLGELLGVTSRELKQKQFEFRQFLREKLLEEMGFEPVPEQRCYENLEDILSHYQHNCYNK